MATKPNPFAKKAAGAKPAPVKGAPAPSSAPKGGAKGAKAALFQPKGRGMVAPPARKAK